MATPVVQPITGEDLCPGCDGKRVIPWKKVCVENSHRLGSLRVAYENLLYDDDFNAFCWCYVCGGSGTATDAMTRLLLGCNQSQYSGETKKP